ncbi:fatty-acid amide hydrolase 2-like [Parasteatoda tepidariorum]|uniref:fatty-acid amide hydrolase 2-like n=1 Tax=Parasteatoda tepidariorum TaxID=114398 RepID=UPI0039BC9BC3
MATVFPAGDGVYQQDNALCQKGRIVIDWFEEHSSYFQVMSWPSNSPDLNLIELLWSYLENQIRAATLPSRNVKELQDQLLSAWYQIPQTTYEHLVESMPRRVLAVLRVKGGPTYCLVPNGGCIINPTEETSKFLETGPMCRYIEDLVPIMKILTTNSTEKLDIERKIDFKKLKIFYQINIDDPVLMRVDNEIVTAIKTAIDHFFTEHGVAAEEVNVKLLKLTSALFLPLLFSDVPNLIQHISQGKINSMNGILELVKFAFGRTKFSLGTIALSGFGEYFSNRDKIHLYKNLLHRLEEDFESILDENSVFFCPTLPFSAPRHYAMVPDFLNAAYVGGFNFLGFPVTQCPLGLNHAGLPHGMQIIARKNNDALTLACAKELDKVFGGWIPPS